MAYGKKELVKVSFWNCPNCLSIMAQAEIFLIDSKTLRQRLIWPFAADRFIPLEVPEHVRKDYAEAAEVLPISEKASAALSRRCLQTVLREAGGSNKTDLSDQIEEVLPSLPKAIQESVDHIRVIGNFATHPIKSKSSGEMIAVEPGEAVWNLDVLDMLFDFYYVVPKKVKEKREAANRKLAEAGKPPMK